MTTNWAPPRTDVVQTTLMEQYSLGGSNPSLSVLHIAENTTFAVTLGADPRPRYVLRVYRAGRHSGARVDSELAWVEALAESGIPTARPQRSLDGALTGRLVDRGETEVRFALLDYLPSDSVDPDLVESMSALGRVAGALQEHARTWDAPHYFDRPTWDAEATLTEATSWGRWISSDLPLETQRVLLEAHLSVLDELPPVAGRNRVLQHADLKMQNAIWSGGRLHVIDFDDSGYSWPLFDLAATLTGLENADETPQFVDAWLAGYGERSDVTDGDIALIPALLMQRRLMILGWLIAHPEGHPAVSRSDVLADTADMARRYLDGALLTRSH